jgi:hypothetical protein
MTVGDLMHLLSALPSDAPVVVPYYESDWGAVAHVHLCRGREQSPRPYTGEYWIPSEYCDAEDLSYECERRGPERIVVALTYAGGLEPGPLALDVEVAE